MQTKDSILEKLQPVFRRVLNDKELVLTEEMSADQHKRWDSMSHITLIVEAELAFNIRFKNKEIASLSNVGDLVNVIEKKL